MIISNRFMSMKKILLLMLLSVLILTACGTKENSSNTQSDVIPPEYAGKTNPLAADAAAAGADVFKSNCQMCHGENGHGDGPASGSLDPKPKNLAVLQQTAADDYLYWRINTGKPGTSMVAWKGILTDEQIWQVVSFIRTLK
jgi:mono/diheme cytochrome c family protein